MLSGSITKSFLNIKTLLAKVLGLIAALAGGLSVGKEGPFVHISTCIAFNMMKLPIFKRIRKVC